jgi:hypothetical protein
MLKARRHERFSDKPIFVRAAFFQQYFDRHASIEAFVTCGQDAPDATSTNLAVDSINVLVDHRQLGHVRPPGPGLDGW